MKNNLLLLAVLLQSLAFGQTPDPFAAFSAKKQTLELSTGITLKYVEAGNKQGEPVILLHGYTDTGRSFQEMMDELARIDPGLHIIAPDLRGHGGSSMPEDPGCRDAPETCFRPADFAADIVALMDALGLAQSHLVGHSMGSAVAQELALRHAGRVKSLVLIGTFVDGRQNAAFNQFLMAGLVEGPWKATLTEKPGFRWPADAWWLTPSGMDPSVTDFLKENWVVDPVANDAFQTAVLPETTRVPLGAWIGALRNLAQVDNREAIRQLKKPTLILWATQDNFFLENPDQQEVKSAFAAATQTWGTRVVYKVYGKIPLDASGMQTNDLGHNLHWGAPREVAADIASFIRTGEPKAGLPYANPKNIKEVLVEEIK